MIADLGFQLVNLISTASLRPSYYCFKNGWIWHYQNSTDRIALDLCVLYNQFLIV